MKLTRLAWHAAAALFIVTQAACDDPAEAACEKARECGLLDKDATIDECVRDLKHDLPEGRLNECADCVDDRTCSELDDGEACENACDD